MQFILCREVVEKYTDLKQSITRRLLECLPQIKSSKVYRTALWIIGEYSTTSEDIDNVFTTIKEALGELPLVPEEVYTPLPTFSRMDRQKKRRRKRRSPRKRRKHPRKMASPLQTGSSYRMGHTLLKAPSQKHLLPFQRLLMCHIYEVLPPNSIHSCQALLLGGDFFLGSVLAATLTKLVLKSSDQVLDQVTKNMLVAEVC